MTDAIDLSTAVVAAKDCPNDVKTWRIGAAIEAFEIAETEKFERGDTMVEFAGRDALPPAFGSQGAISYTLWMGCRIRGTWHVLPIVECIRGYVPTGKLLADNQVKANLVYFADEPLKSYQPARGELVAFFCTTGDTRRQNVQAIPPFRTNVVVVPFMAGRWTFDATAPVVVAPPVVTPPPPSPTISLPTALVSSILEDIVRRLDTIQAAVEKAPPAYEGRLVVSQRLAWPIGNVDINVPIRLDPKK